jgi:hypothetical protein
MKPSIATCVTVLSASIQTVASQSNSTGTNSTLPIVDLGYVC